MTGMYVNTYAWAIRTLQAFHPIQLCEQLVDHTVSDPRAVVTSTGGQRVELIEEEDARLGCLGSVRDKDNV